MKLRNKKTGEIWEIEDSIAMKATHETATKAGCPSGVLTLYADSIKELTEEWEDYEEQKEYWWIDTGSIPMVRKSNNPILPLGEDIDKQIGNYFDTEEEAEKAVEKLKAWTRLKNKGFRFEPVGRYEDLCGNGFNIPITATMPPEAYTDVGVSKDLDILFGGEE